MGKRKEERRERRELLGSNFTVLPFVCLSLPPKFFVPRVQSLQELVTWGFLLFLTLFVYLYHLSRRGNNLCMRFPSFIKVIC
ncbi:hypothetical protein PHAVU_011G165200 [Phaseolus vulgaris]|uniref:Uncharacterized protein n=1 Tax=Phaseolus vulgaris TaxID=3885 RepID=V7AJ47_PHAVU|nr:hypothetical protein PHAVU_011G165200g [Phaseolus vulgaris]ESW05260.1 hypothetical protein PHAVU_011G165200g [Phaseolus vulgaris]